MAQPVHSIPDFGLYGELHSSSMPGYVHIEDIADRSSARGWHIKPHRHGSLFQVLCIFDGRLEVQLDDHSHALCGSWAITIPARVVHGFRFAPDSSGVVLTVAEPLLSDEHHPNRLEHFGDLISTPLTVEFHENDALLAQLIQYTSLMKGEFQQFNIDRNLMLEWLVKLVLLTVKRQLEQGRFSSDHTSPGPAIVNRFRVLLETNYRKHWSVAQYARALHISTSTLGRLCHEALGSNPKRLIQNRVLIEAKRRLLYTRESLDQTAYKLGFKDPAYFSRFFKARAGVTPGDYRRNT